ncbi:hypothetical protein [Faecalibacterium prausnitzii]|jgi:hypothetical protein|uniref:hypothetical protein n=2 Tax=Faecalibacterium prausnitzii TaxID=853 RepID=UPI0022E64FCA|nr:hypothetical protein [Faecalibacterium prausnitzii]
MNLRIHALKKASRQRPGVKIAAARFFSILYYPFCAKRSSFFQQNVQPRGNFFANRPIFVYFADVLPRLTGAKWFVILLTIVPAGSRTRAGSSLPLIPASNIFLKQTPRRGLPLAWNAGAGSFLFCG